MTIQTHTVLQKLCLGIKITTQGNYVTLILICHDRKVVARTLRDEWT